MKIGTKVTIKDGSYMVTVKDGKISREGNFDSTRVIGWCKDTFTLIYNRGNLPGKNSMGDKYVNNYIISNDVNGEVWFCSHINVREVKPQFKVGDWLMIVRGDFICDYHPDGKHRRGFKEGGRPNIYLPVRLIEKKELNYPDAHIVEQNGNVFIYSHAEAFRLATKGEIESHLRKIADEKYIGQKINNVFFKGNTSEICEFWQYEKEGDKMWYRCIDGSSAYVYRQGEWADIVPSKKKLPKTKIEIMELMQDYRKSELKLTSFLEDYED